jgi:serine/threonine protein kinase
MHILFLASAASALSLAIHKEKRAEISNVVTLNEKFDDRAVSVAPEIIEKTPETKFHFINGVKIPSAIFFKSIGNIEIPMKNYKIVGVGSYAITFLTNVKDVPVVVKIPKSIPKGNSLKSGPSTVLDTTEIIALKRMGQHLDDSTINDGRRVIAMKFAKGSTFHQFISEGNIKTEKKFNQLWDAAIVAMRDMHSKGIVHNDLHMNNFIVENNGGIKDPFTVTIIDFGLANLLKEGEKVSGALAQTDINSITKMFGKITKMISSQME